ncbi:hypothetical protein [Micromonospora sp. KC207]|nr:hypothetical protein [Micromonospora sp. KC207]
MANRSVPRRCDDAGHDRLTARMFRPPVDLTFTSVEETHDAC